MNLDDAKFSSVTTLAVKIQEWTTQMLMKTVKDRTSTFRSATIRASCMYINRVDVQQAVKEVGRSERGRVDHARASCSIFFGRLVQEISEHRHVKASRVDTDSDYVGCVITGSTISMALT